MWVTGKEMCKLCNYTYTNVSVRIPPWDSLLSVHTFSAEFPLVKGDVLCSFYTLSCHQEGDRWWIKARLTTYQLMTYMGQGHHAHLGLPGSTAPNDQAADHMQHWDAFLSVMRASSIFRVMWTWDLEKITSSGSTCFHWVLHGRWKREGGKVRKAVGRTNVDVFSRIFCNLQSLYF